MFIFSEYDVDPFETVQVPNSSKLPSCAYTSCALEHGWREMFFKYTRQSISLMLMIMIPLTCHGVFAVHTVTNWNHKYHLQILPFHTETKHK